MELFYRSTRDSRVKVKASEAILKGLADDGGLFVPDRIPELSQSLSELSQMTYQEIAADMEKTPKSIDNALQRIKGKIG